MSVLMLGRVLDVDVQRPWVEAFCAAMLIEVDRHLLNRTVVDSHLGYPMQHEAG